MNTRDKTIRARVYGRVQGVYFRYHTKLMADGLDLGGWVRNCSDGSVEILCSGAPSSVDQMLDWLHRGPEAAMVENVDVQENDNLSVPSGGFSIRY